MALPVLAMAWLFAFAATGLWGVAPWIPAVMVAALIPAAAYRWSGRGAAVVAIASVLTLVAGFRSHSWLAPSHFQLPEHVGEELTLEGRIDGEPNPGLTTTGYTVAVTRAETTGSDVMRLHEKVRITVGEYERYLPGTPVRLRGKLGEAPQFPDFDYRAYLAHRGVSTTMLYPDLTVTGPAPRLSVAPRVTRARLALDRGLARSLPEPEASLAAGIAFGRDDNVPDDLYKDFRRTGLAHIVAVSGSNITLVTGIVFFVLVPTVGRRIALWPAGAAAIAYVVLAGASASVVRAGIMAMVFLLGSYLGRPQSGLAALGLAAIVMTGLSPGAAYDTGFQLSFAATAGLIVFGPWVRWTLLRGLGPRLRAIVPETVVTVASLSLCATLATLPLIWVAFGQVSLIGPLANIVMEPVFVVAFALGALAAAVSVAWEPGGWVLGLIAYYPLAFMTWFAAAMASVPLAAVEVPRSDGSSAFTAYIVLCVAGWPAYRRLPPDLAPPRRLARETRSALRRSALAGGVACLGVAAIPASLLPLGGPGRLEVTALDVGQGDAILVTTPHGKHLLVDGGPSGIGLARELGATLPHWQRSIDIVALTHPQQDHIAGLVELLERYHAGEVMESGSRNPTPADELYQQRAGPRRVLKAGDAIDLDGVHVEVLWPPAGYEPKGLNDTSLILRLTYGETRVLLTGDSEAPAHRQLMAGEDVAADILKVPHHGSKTSDPEFLRAVNPAVSLISVGVGNQFGHPAASTLETLGGSKILRTDQCGRVTVSSDGHTLRMKTARRGSECP